MKIIKNLTIHALLFLALLTLFSGLCYRVYSLNSLGIAISLILAIILFIILQKIKYGKSERFLIKPSEAIKPEKLIIKTKLIFIYLLYTVIFVFLLLMLFLNRSSQSIASPWEVVPAWFFLGYLFLLALLIYTIISYRSYSTPLIFMHVFLSLSVAAIIYKLGFGFDGFIHDATLKLIKEQGFVDPKPMYYLGYYGLIIVLNFISFIPLEILNRYIVPALAFLAIVPVLKTALKRWFPVGNELYLCLAILPSLVIALFFTSTPQAFAYLLALFVFILGPVAKNEYELSALFVLALAALITQPIAGVPAVLFLIFLLVELSDLKIKKIVLVLVFMANIAALPLAFGLLSVSGPAAATLNRIDETTFVNFPVLPQTDNPILASVYLIGSNAGLLIFLLIIFGVLIFLKHRESCRLCLANFASFISLSISFLILKNFDFSFLISYERGDYPYRVLLMSAIAASPFIIFAVYGFISKLMLSPKPVRLAMLSVIVLGLGACFYLSYPRLDALHNSHSYSVGNNDIDAVRWINDNAQTDFIVLANQQVSAAALHEFGFKKYYRIKQNGREQEMFYYPIPTGGPLYPFYLSMVYEKPARETVLKAMALANVEQGYFVLNKYWWAFPKILEEAKLETDSWTSFENGQAFVFSYKLQ